MLKDLLKGNKEKGEAWITEGREKVSLDEAIAATQGKMTLRHAEIVNDRKRDRQYAICVCDEIPNGFFFVGSVMVALIQRLTDKVGSVEGFKAALEEEGLQVLVEKKRSEKTGNIYTSVTVL